MAATQDFTAAMKDMMGAFPMDMAAFEDAWKNSAGISEKASAIALDAAGKTTDISVGWTMETLTRIGDLAKAKPAPADYAQAMSEFASAQMQSLNQHMTAYGDVAKSAQSDALALMMSVGKDVADDVTATTATTAKATEKAATKTASAATTTAKRSTTAAKRTTTAAKKTATTATKAATTAAAPAPTPAPAKKAAEDTPAAAPAAKPAASEAPKASPASDETKS
ncbi:MULTISPECIES: phasin [Salipiger]|uniref:phasin n=1 Tax=Salipiger TaxID=263377 RepID=UPI000C93F5B7|nr:phasin [Pelagibaca sp.]MBR9891176.1 phasin [bacterium]